MRTGKRIAALLLVIALAAGLAACAAAPSGTYYAVRVVKNGIEANAEALAQGDEQISITFSPDGTGVLRSNAASEPFTWSGNTMTPQLGGDPMDFRFDGKTLILERGDTRIEFQ